jgi:hypothetical protein
MTCTSGAGKPGVLDVFGILRRHRGAEPFRGFNQDVCMHASDPFIRRSHTTGSLVVELDSSSGFRIFVTGGSSPCLTPFKPVLPEDVPGDIARGGARYDEGSYWWRNEAFRIEAEMRLSLAHELVGGDIRDFEERFCRDIPLYPWRCADDALRGLSHGAFRESSRLLEEWTARIRGKDRDRHPIHNAFWSMVARRGGVPLP